MLTWPLYSIDQISTIVNYHGISIDSIIGCVGGRLNIALINIGIIASSIEEYSQILGLVELFLVKDCNPGTEFMALSRTIMQVKEAMLGYLNI